MDHSSQDFVIIFRQGRRSLSEADLSARAAATRAWAREQNAAGHALVPHILGPERERLGPEDAAAGDGAPITAILLLQARDFQDAVDVARAHPALRYGASVEVRAWARPQSP
jgi:hypothetical protein